MMISRDTRSLPAAALEDLRRRAVAAVESGCSQVEVARLLGVSRKTVGVWVRAYRSSGEAAFPPRRRGRRPGEQLALSVPQQRWVVKTMVTSSPDEVSLRYRLWTRQSVAELINREFQVMLSCTTIGQYLLRWGLFGERDLRRSPAEDSAPVVPSPRSAEPVAPKAETLRVVWLQPGSSCFDEFRDVHVLVAMSGRGVLYFFAGLDPFDLDGIRDFSHRLTGQVRRKVTIDVRWWPVQHFEVLRAWLDDGDVAVHARFL